ncbi:B3 domain-containing protein [Apostasia shenzhenica]|uniref:Riboflavin synthase n=1 Tax=Apostasia shenzhenica TaxID=1088818 RepID=A0A2I0AYM5_9ASPA|nr:B3 domain-containing protein [Apostasia shenzhenica]
MVRDAKPQSSSLKVLPASIQRALPRTTVPIALACRGNTWKVKYSGSCLVRRFESGWRRFVEDNNVRAGDGCVFEIMDDQELKFEVQILDGQLPFHPAGRGTTIDSAIESVVPVPALRPPTAAPATSASALCIRMLLRGDLGGAEGRCTHTRQDLKVASSSSSASEAGTPCYSLLVRLQISNCRVSQSPSVSGRSLPERARKNSSLSRKSYCGNAFFKSSSIPLRTHLKSGLITLKSRGKTTKCLFTGIVEEVGRILHLGPNKDGGFDMKIDAKTVLGGVSLGDSIAVNGTCLTVSEFDQSASHFTVGLSPETLRKTSLSELVAGSPVNLERALQPISRMGGHFVQGHVDGTGEIVKFEPEGDSLWVKVRTSPELLRYIVPKGFITVDGTSLTVVRVYEDENCFDFMLVAYTQQKVVIPMKKVGDKVNLEVDILGKYVEKILKSGLATVGFQSAS